MDYEEDPYSFREGRARELTYRQRPRLPDRLVDGYIKIAGQFVALCFFVCMVGVLLFALAGICVILL